MRSETTATPDMPIASAQQSIFEEGRNCRRVADAGRVAFIVDGDDYFKRFMEAAERARESIIVVAWDFNSNCCLSVECDSTDPRAKLGEYLNYLPTCRDWRRARASTCTRK